MPSYQINGTIKNNNEIEVSYFYAPVFYDSNDTIIFTGDLSSGIISASSSTNIEITTKLTSTIDEQFSYMVVNVYFSASGYVDSETATLTIDKPTAMIYGVEWTNDSSTSMTRTDDAVGMTYTKNSDGTITSDFNDVFPYNEMVKSTDSDGNVWVHLPQMWFRITTDSSNNITGVAVSKEEGTEGNWFQTKELYVSAYGASGSSSAIKSVSGATRLVSVTQQNWRTYIKNTNSKYTMLDLYTRTILNFLWWIEFATKNSSNVMTGRTSEGHSISSYANTGGTDSLSTPSGWSTSNYQMRWHYIEDFFGNYLDVLDGCYRYGATVYYTSDISNYSDSTSGKSYSTGASSSGYVYAWHWDNSNPFLCIVSSTNSTRGGFYNYRNVGTTSNPIAFIGSCVSSSERGLVYSYSATTSAAFSDTGARLVKHV